MEPTILKRDRVRLSDAPAPSGAARARSKSASSCAKRVELLREGGIVHALELTCSCGEVTVIELLYPEKGPEAGSQEVS